MFCWECNYLMPKIKTCLSILPVSRCKWFISAGFQDLTCTYVFIHDTWVPFLRLSKTGFLKRMPAGLHPDRIGIVYFSYLCAVYWRYQECIFFVAVSNVCAFTILPTIWSVIHSRNTFGRSLTLSFFTFYLNIFLRQERSTISIPFKGCIFL